MTRIFTVMYIICSIYSSNPDIPEPYITQNIAQETQPGGGVYRYEEEIAIPEDKPVDYVEELKRLNYYKAESTDNKLNIRNAVIRFQSDHNLNVDGIWGKRSFSALKKRISCEDLSYPDTVESPPSSGKWLVINKTKRILTLYQGKNVVKKYPVAIGNPPSNTPSGKFYIAYKTVNPTWGGGGYAQPVAGGSPQNPLGYRWMGLSIKGGDRYGIHGNNSPYSIGKNISHGCIRMINSDVEELFEIVPKQSNVWIGTGQELLEWGITQKEYGT